MTTLRRPTCAQRVGQCLAWPFPGPRTAILVILLSMVELISLTFHSSGFWNNSGLSNGTLFSLVGTVILSWTVIVWCGHVYFWMVLYVRGRIASPWLQKVVLITAIGLVTLLVNLYLACWFFFWRIGVFPDPDSLYFGGMNADMLVKYFWQAERFAWISCLVIFAMTTVTFCFVAWTNLKRICRLDHRRNVFYRLGAVSLVSVNVAILSLDLSHPRVRGSQRISDARIEAAKNLRAPSSYEFRYHVNPAVTLAASYFNSNKPKVTGSIPLDALTPLERLKPTDSRSIAADGCPNVILICVESLRSDVVRMTHQGRKVMPCLAELARTGRFFPNCYANSTHSDYSDPSILSSLYPMRSLRRHFYRREDPWPKVLIFDLFKQYGYATAMFSSQNEAWSNMHLFYETPNLDMLFDSRSFEGPTQTDEGYFAYWVAETGQLAGKLDDNITMEHAIDWIREKQARGQPFCMSLNLQTSHFPYVRPDGKQGPFEPAVIDFHASLNSYPPEKAPVIRNAYYNALQYVDDEIERLINFLDSTQLREDTIIAIIGDHGEAFYENGICGHAGKPLETVIKVGLVINWPASIKSKTDEYLAQAIDVVPTIAQLSGLPAHPAFQGIDLLSNDRQPLNERLVFVHCSSPITGSDTVISGTGWKYTYESAKDLRELHFRPTDLNSHANLHDTFPGVAAALHETLVAWKDRQLTYYQRPRYYNWFHPPLAAKLNAQQLKLLVNSAKHAEADNEGPPQLRLQSAP